MRRPLLPAALVAILALVLAACGDGGSGGATGDGASPAGEREEASPFEVPALVGDGRLSLADYRGTPVVLNFWASWCGPCREEMPELASFAEDTPGVRVVGLAVEDREEDSRRFAREHGVGFDLGVDREGEVASRYGVTGLPVTVVIDAEGRVATTWFGPVGRSDLDLFARQLGL